LIVSENPRKEGKNFMTKTDMIREHLRSLPPSDRSPTAVMKALRKKGCRVTRNHVSVVKSGMSRGDSLPAGRDLVLAKRFLDKVGGTAKARELISLVSRIVN
jgi:hypothetical protein